MPQKFAQAAHTLRHSSTDQPGPNPGPTAALWRRALNFTQVFLNPWSSGLIHGYTAVLRLLSPLLPALEESLQIIIHQIPDSFDLNIGGGKSGKDFRIKRVVALFGKNGGDALTPGLLERVKNPQ